MAKTQDDREPMVRATDDEASKGTDAEFENDELEGEEEDEDDKADAEDVR